MKLALITKDRCLDSILAKNHIAKLSEDVEIVAIEEVPDVAEIYGVERFPTLLRIGKHGMVRKVEGFNEAKYDAFIKGGNGI